MNTHQLISKLRAQLTELEKEVLQHDAQILPGQKKLLQDIERFNDELFIQAGAGLSSCIPVLVKDIDQLERLIQRSAAKENIIISCERIQQRFTAVKRALTTTSIDVKAQKQHKAGIRARAIKNQQKSHSQSGFGWIASSVMQSSHQLYGELNKHLNWATKIEQKIEQLQFQLETCHSADKIEMQNTILLMHKRLGKCRQAISYIEERIQAFERPFQNNHR